MLTDCLQHMECSSCALLVDHSSPWDSTNTDIHGNISHERNSINYLAFRRVKVHVYRP